MIFGSQKRDPCKSFYMVPNEIMRLGLSVGEIAVYNYLMYCEDHKTYQCYPSYRKMGEALGLTRKTVMKYVRSLEEKCLITTEHFALPAFICFFVCLFFLPPEYFTAAIFAQ